MFIWYVSKRAEARHLRALCVAEVRTSMASTWREPLARWQWNGTRLRRWRPDKKDG